VRIPCRTLLLSCLLGSLAPAAQAQDGQGHAGLSHHPPEDQRLHEKILFYMAACPIIHSVSCCNDADCYPTEIRTIDGNIYAKRRKTESTFPFQRKSRAEQRQSGRQKSLCLLAE